MIKTFKPPRAASTYRGHRRNHYVGVRAGFTRFDGWSNIHAINNKAGLAARQSQANSAREVAAKALVNNKAGRPADVVCRCGPVCLPRLLPQAAAHPPCEPDHP